MDEKQSPSTNAIPPAAPSADALREIRERAHAAVAAQRARMGQLESQLTQQLDSIASALADQAAMDAVQSNTVADVTERERSLDARQAELDERRIALDRLETELTASAAERGRILDLRQSELEDRHTAIEYRQTELDSLANELSGQRQSLERREAAVQTQEGNRQQQDNNLDFQRTNLDDREAALHVQEAELGDLQQKLDSRDKALTAMEQDLAVREQAYALSEQQLSNSKMQLDERVEELAVREVAAELAQTRFDAEASTQSGLQTSWEEDRQRLCGDVVAAQTERDELRQKFELALADMQDLRGRMVESEQELASRPAAGETASVELVQVRAERDAMSVRIAELERQPAAAPAGEPSEEMEVLQRRFELAVDDVRDLKRKNSDLESQLAEVKSLGVVAVPAAGGNSWESMKKQMLAQLAGESDDGDAERQQERATIESTIQITDDVVATKDLEIAELKVRLGSSNDRSAAEEYSVRELVDSDAVIQQHRERTGKLEQEMEDKLRAAEMELSLERAKIAREQAQLADLRAEIDSLRAAMGETGGSGGGGQAPKRRWLSKLGLSGDDE